MQITLAYAKEVCNNSFIETKHTKENKMSNEMMKARKEMDSALIEMARTEKYPELYQAAKNRHTVAKRKVIELWGK